MPIPTSGNTDWQITKSLIKQNSAPELEDYLSTTWKDYKLLKSFIHLHLGFRGDGLPPQHCEALLAQCASARTVFSMVSGISSADKVPGAMGCFQ